MGCGVSFALSEDTTASHFAFHEDSIKMTHKQFSQFDINRTYVSSIPYNSMFEFRQHKDIQYFYYDKCDEFGRRIKR